MWSTSTFSFPPPTSLPPRQALPTPALGSLCGAPTRILQTVQHQPVHVAFQLGCCSSRPDTAWLFPIPAAPLLPPLILHYSGRQTVQEAMEICAGSLTPSQECGKCSWAGVTWLVICPHDFSMLPTARRVQEEEEPLEMEGAEQPHWESACVGHGQGGAVWKAQAGAQHGLATQGGSSVPCRVL